MPSRQYGAPRDPRRGPTGGDGVGTGAVRYGERVRDAQEPKTKKEDPSPSSNVVTKFHKNADTDVRKESIHHTLGSRPSQASPGDHTHNGGDSKQILEGFTIVGSKSSPSTMWPSIIACLVRLGAEDSTTA